MLALDADARLLALQAELTAAERGRTTHGILDATPEATLQALAAETSVPVPLRRIATPIRVIVPTPVPLRAATPAPLAVRPVEVSDPPLPIPEVDDDSPSPPSAPDLAVDDLDILEGEESPVDADSLLADPPSAVDAMPMSSLGDPDAGLADNTVDRDLKAFFADESLDASQGDSALLRPPPGESDELGSGASKARRSKRDNSLLSNVKKLFKK